MGVRRHIPALTLIALALAPGAARPGQIAPPGFLAIPGVGKFTPNQIGRFDGATKKFQGAPVLADATGRLAVAGTPLEANRYVNVKISGSWPITVADLQLGVSAGYFSLQNSANGFTVPLQATGITTADDPTTVTHGGHLHADYFGTGTTGQLAGVQFATKNFSTGTVNRAIAADCLAEQLGNGHTLVSSMLRLKYHENVGTVDEMRGLDLSTWGDLTVGNVGASVGIYADHSIDVGTGPHHFINSFSTSPSDFSGDLVVTDPTKGVILKAPGGHFFRITVADSGALSTSDLGTAVP